MMQGQRRLDERRRCRSRPPDGRCSSSPSRSGRVDPQADPADRTRPSARASIGIADQRAGAVGFDVLDCRRVTPAFRYAWRSSASCASWLGTVMSGRSAILIHGSTADDGINAIAVRQRAGQRLEDDHAGALAADEAVGRGVEGMAAAVRRQHAQPAKTDVPVRQQQGVDAAGQRQRAFLPPRCSCRPDARPPAPTNRRYRRRRSAPEDRSSTRCGWRRCSASRRCWCTCRWRARSRKSICTNEYSQLEMPTNTAVLLPDKSLQHLPAVLQRFPGRFE